MIKRFLSLALTTALTSATQLSEMFAQISELPITVNTERTPHYNQLICHSNKLTIEDCAD